MPARLRTFDVEEWTEPGDPDDAGWKQWAAQGRYFAARRAWCEEHGVDYVMMLRRERSGRLAALRAEMAETDALYAKRREGGR